jgi:NAD-dependent dihydropyrimidine dehydrogenase PreA subunit
MTYVIADPCIDIKDRNCIQQCPVDCIYEGGRALYVNADECIECGACEPACPVEAIYFHEDLPREYAASLASNSAFFSTVLPGRQTPLGTPGGARKVGPLDVDTDFVAAVPSRSK